MSAVVVKLEQRRDTDWPHARLVRWANWARCAAPGAVGTSEGYLRERLDPEHDTEPTPEIEVTERAVGKMKVDRPDYWKPFAMFYLNPTELSFYEIGTRTGYNEDRVRAMIRQARMLVGYHILQFENG